jgi:hypothetical protein
VIIRRRYNRNFTVLPNAVFDDARLTPEALGVLVYLRSRPEAWNVDLAQLGERFRMGRDKTQRVIAELVSAGWIKRERTRDPITKAFNGIEYVVYDEPGDTTSGDVEDEPQPEKPVVGGEPQPEKPRAANPVVHIEETNTEREKITPIAPQGGGVGKVSTDWDEETEAQFGVLIRSLQPDPAYSEVNAKRAFLRLSAAERAEAIAGAPRYIAHCRAAKRRACDPSTYLNQRRWKNFPALSAKAEPVARGAEDDPVKRAVQWAMSGIDRAEWVFVEEGSDAWAAWQAAYRHAGFAHRFTMGRHELVRGNDGGWVQSEHKGRTFPRRYPPKADAASTDPPRGMTADDHDVVASGL